MLEVNFTMLPDSPHDVAGLLHELTLRGDVLHTFVPISFTKKKEFIDMHFGDRHSTGATGRRTKLSTGAILEVYTEQSAGWMDTDWICYRYIIPGVGTRIVVYGQHIPQCLMPRGTHPKPMWVDAEAIIDAHFHQQKLETAK